MKIISKQIKENLLIIILCIPFIVNLFLNVVNDFSIIENLTFQNLISLISFCLGSIFYLSLFRKLNEYLEVGSISLTATYFLISYFLFDSLLLFISRELLFSTSFLVVSTIWISVLLFKKIKIKDLTLIALTYFLFRFFNNQFFNVLSNNGSYEELNTDVPAQWKDLATMIFDENYFFSLINNPLSGQGLLISYIQSLLLKINFYPDNFIFIKTNYNLLLFFTFLLIFDLKIQKKNKIISCFGLTVFLINNEWLYYLLANSLMLEGIVSFFFGVYVYYYLFYLKKNTIHSLFFFLCFGSLVLSKNFVSLIALGLVILSLLFIKRNKYVIFGIIPYLTSLIYESVYTSEIKSWAHTDEINFESLLLDLILFRDLEIVNVINIFNEFLIDKPTSYLYILFFVSSVFYFLNTDKSFNYIYLSFLIVFINYLLVNLLYISYWQDIEYKSSYRYIVNTFHIVFITLCINFNKFEVKSKNKQI